MEGNEKKSKDSLLKAYDKKRIKQGGPEMPCIEVVEPPCVECLSVGEVNPECPPDDPRICDFPDPGELP